MAQPFGSFHVLFGIAACAACLSYPELYFIGLPLKIAIDHLRNICARPFSTRLSKFQAYQKLHYKTSFSEETVSPSLQAKPDTLFSKFLTT